MFVCGGHIMNNEHKVPDVLPPLKGRAAIVKHKRVCEQLCIPSLPTMSFFLSSRFSSLFLELGLPQKNGVLYLWELHPLSPLFCFKLRSYKMLFSSNQTEEELTLLSPDACMCVISAGLLSTLEPDW